MGTLLTIALLLVGLFAIRLLLKARQMANVVNSVSQTGAKVKMTIQMAKSKAGAIAEPGPMTLGLTGFPAKGPACLVN